MEGIGYIINTFLIGSEMSYSGRCIYLTKIIILYLLQLYVKIYIYLYLHLLTEEKCEYLLRNKTFSAQGFLATDITLFYVSWTHNPSLLASTGLAPPNSSSIPDKCGVSLAYRFDTCNFRPLFLRINHIVRQLTMGVNNRSVCECSSYTFGGTFGGEKRLCRVTGASASNLAICIRS